MLKAITLYDPWGSLMAIGAKVNETRPNRTAHRGDIAIHVAKTDYGCSDDVAQAALKAFRKRHMTPMSAFGCIVAVVDLWDVQPSEAFGIEGHAGGLIELTNEEELFGNYSRSRFIYRTRNLRRLKTPIPCRGFQCVGWTVPSEVEAQVRAQLSPQCSFGACTDSRCLVPPTYVSTFNGQRLEMFWCDEHHAALLENPQTPGHSFIKL